MAPPGSAFASAGSDRFASLGARGALALLVALCGLIFLGLWTGATPPHAKGGPPSNDSAVFFRILDDLRQGEGYYPAAIRELRVAGYPMRPFLTVRLPTLALAMAALPDPALRRGLAGGLALVTLAAWLWRLRASMARPLSFSAMVIVMIGALLPAPVLDDYTFHELWSGELIALSLAVYSPRNWVASFVLGCLALSIRELAAPFFLAMGVLAWRDGRRAEAGAWGFGLLAFFGALALHAAAVQSWLIADDPPSAGWLGLVGWPFLLLQTKWNFLLMTASDWVPAVVLPLALFGLIAQRGIWQDRLALVVIGYTLAFLVVGRADNSYWGLLLTPLWPIGFVATGPALIGLVGKLRGALVTAAP